jgi:hypothetical protein
VVLALKKPYSIPVHKWRHFERSNLKALKSESTRHQGGFLSQEKASAPYRELAVEAGAFTPLSANSRSKKVSGTLNIFQNIEKTQVVGPDTFFNGCHT